MSHHALLALGALATLGTSTVACAISASASTLGRFRHVHQAAPDPAGPPPAPQPTAATRKPDARWPSAEAAQRLVEDSALDRLLDVPSPNRRGLSGTQPVAVDPDRVEQPHQDGTTWVSDGSGGAIPVAFH